MRFFFYDYVVVHEVNTPGLAYAAIASNGSVTDWRSASLALSPIYDDPYMKVKQAYDATDNELPQAPIAPPTILPPSPMSPKRTSTSAAPAMTQAAIRQLVVDSIVAALEA
ncbi:hypothetical protein Tco_0345061 [Tanacetum coccineum]